MDMRGQIGVAFLSLCKDLCVCVLAALALAHQPLHFTTLRDHLNSVARARKSPVDYWPKARWLARIPTLNLDRTGLDWMGWDKLGQNRT